ncbi:hypothetical protein HJFPF1_00433 [Paramyrothecium foliicola]|nr:hypothetical protein HJFPF1_00433 [Paramyrothecium foliicola]
MDQVKTATTRLRRTFQYPADDDDDADSTGSQPEALDEEEQEHLIERYAAENASRNDQFRLVLLVIPLLAAVPYLVSLVTRPAAALLALLGLTSLFSSALLVYRQAPAVTGFAPLDAWVRGEDARLAARRDADRLLARRRRGGPLAVAPVADSPLDTYLPYLNLGLAAVIVLMGLVAGPRTAEFGFVGMGNWPALVYANNLVAKAIMGSVDPEKTLSALKYRYKGA